MAELITYYIISGALIIGAPAIFFLIAFMPALQNTKAVSYTHLTLPTTSRV